MFIHDDKNHFTVVINEKLLSAMKTAMEDVPDKPTLKNFQTYVEAMNAFFLHGISGLPCKGKQHMQWSETMPTRANACIPNFSGGKGGPSGPL